MALPAPGKHNMIFFSFSQLVRYRVNAVNNNAFQTKEK